MNRSGYSAERARIERLLADYERANGFLVGIAKPEARVALIEQIIDSERRVEYTRRLASRSVDLERADPRSEHFDPLGASLVHKSAGDYDEAVWMVFLYVHFGKHATGNWRYIRDVYGRLGAGPVWSWDEVSADITSFRIWLDENESEIHSGPGGFGNHRKYESLAAWSEGGTGAVVESYVDWVIAAGGGHRELFDSLTDPNPGKRFDLIYRSMGQVRRFGRTGRFDYLTMLQKLALLDIRPQHAYLSDATGPRRGASLLLFGDPKLGSLKDTKRGIENLVAQTGLEPNIIEDAVCNWQKSPEDYKQFRS